MTVQPCVAKLPRLMQAGLPQFIDPERFADKREDLSGVLPIDSMQRLHELLSKKTGSVQFELHFDKDKQGRIHISGQYNASLNMNCQRCLRSLEVDICGLFNVVLVTDEDEAAKLPRDVEPLILTERKLSLPIFFEDELILSLPLAPNHETNECHGQDRQVGEGKVDRQRPFAVLKDLKLIKNKD